MRFKVVLLASVFTLGFGVSGIAAAENAAADGAGASLDDVFSLSLSETLSTQVTVGTKSAMTIADSPSSVTVFTRKEIQRMAVSNVEELLNYVAGMTVTNDTFQAKTVRINARGIQSFFQTAVLFLVNGQPINDLFYGTSTIMSRHIALDNVAQVEVIRGPGSAIYGANAFAAVVNIVTVDDLNSVSATAGDIGRKSVAVNLHKEEKLWGETVKVTGYAQGYSDDGYQFKDVQDAWGGQGDTSDAIQGFDVNTKIAVGDFSLSFYNNTRQTRGFLGYGALGEFNRGHWRQTFVDLAYTTNLGDGATEASSTKLKAGLRFIDEWHEPLSLLLPRNLNLGSEDQPFILENDYYGGPSSVTQGIRAYVEADAELFEGNRMVAGLVTEYRYQHALSNIHSYHPQTLEVTGGLDRYTDPDTNWSKHDAKQFLVGAFLQDQWDITDDLTMFLGLRFDYNSVYGESLSPRAAVTYTAPWEGTLKAMYGRAFLAPNFSELYEQNNPVIVGNPDLESEFIHTIELAYSQKMSDFGTATLTGFYNSASNLIVLGEPLEGTGLRPYANQGSLHTQGMELELRLFPVDFLDIRGTYALVMAGSFEEEESTIEQSPHSGSVIANLNFGNINLNASAYFRTKSDLLDSQDTYVIASSRASYALTQNFTLSFAMENIADTVFYGPSEYIRTTGVPHRGRTMFVELRYAD